MEIADKEFPVADKPQSDSRITLLTGVHRKEVKRLRNAPSDDKTIPESVSLGALLVANWVGNSRYLDAQNKPLSLPRFSTKDGKPSFEELVTSVSKDIRPRVVLDEWLRLGICKLDDDDNVSLIKESFIPEKGFEEKLYFLGKNVHDHLAASVHNIHYPQDTFLERSVYYDELTFEDTETLAELTRDLGNEILRKTNQRAMQLQQSYKSAKSRDYRMNFGIYFYRECDIESQDPEKEKES